MFLFSLRMIVQNEKQKKIYCKWSAKNNIFAVHFNAPADVQ